VEENEKGYVRGLPNEQCFLVAASPWASLQNPLWHEFHQNWVHKCQEPSVQDLAAYCL